MQMSFDFYALGPSIHKPSNTWPYKQSHNNRLLSEESIIRISMLQSEGLIYSQHSLILNLFDEESHTREDLSQEWAEDFLLN